jgi:hypothetical protein
MISDGEFHFGKGGNAYQDNHIEGVTHYGKGQ